MFSASSQLSRDGLRINIKDIYWEGVVKMAFFDTFMIKRTINEEIIILLLQQVKIGD